MKTKWFKLFVVMLGAGLMMSCDDEGPELEGDDPGECHDGADNDGDGYFDCDDQDCFGSPDCETDGDADGDEDLDADEADADGDCEPSCEGRECGSDGCDGTCGAGCSDGWTCYEPRGRCQPGEWVSIPAGSFIMGSPESELGREDDELQHSVTLTRSFAIQTTEVTQGQFQAMMSYNFSFFINCGEDCPVEQVSWHEAAAYCNVLSLRVDLEPCYECTGDRTTLDCDLASEFSTPYECPGYRLPTEAEWEYAARAGDTRATYNGNLDESHLGCEQPNSAMDPIAWFCGNSVATYFGASTCSDNGGQEFCGPSQVGILQENSLGLHDMLGSVSEWCMDRYGDYPRTAVIDPSGPTSGMSRICRGGSWNDQARMNRLADRITSYQNNAIGFRPVRTLP